MKWRRIKVPIYRTELFFCAEKDFNKVIKKVYSLGFSLREKDRKELEGVDSAGVTIPIMDKYNVRSYLMWLPKHSSSLEDMDTLIHELTHVKNYIFKHIGQSEGLPADYDELEAYLMGYLTYEALSFLRRK